MDSADGKRNRRYRWSCAASIAPRSAATATACALPLATTRAQSIEYQFFFRASMDLRHNVQAETQIAWQITPAIELSLAGNTLLSTYHMETVEQQTSPFEGQRRIYLGPRWKY